MSASSDAQFTDDIPRVYDSAFVPLIFAEYATDIAARAAALRPAAVLEVACGTGVVTRALADALPPDCAIVATDLNAAMVEYARSRGTSRSVHWDVADVMTLGGFAAPFDVVICQFGVMFFPDRITAYGRIRDVLRPGGTFLFSVWRELEHSEIPNAVTQALALLFPEDPPMFLARTPHGYADADRVERDVRAAGFSSVHVTRIDKVSRAADAAAAAHAVCLGSPLRNEIEARAPGALRQVVEHVAGVLRQRYGEGPIEGPISAYVIEAKR